MGSSRSELPICSAPYSVLFRFRRSSESYARSADFFAIRPLIELLFATIVPTEGFLGRSNFHYAGFPPSCARNICRLVLRSLRDLYIREAKLWSGTS